MLSGIVNRSLQEFILSLGKMNLMGGLLHLFSGFADRDRLKRLIFLTEFLILLDFFLISVYIMIVSDVDKFRFILGIIMNGRIVGVEHLVFSSCGSGIGIAEIREWVYGCSGKLNSSSASATSTMVPL